MTAELAWKDFIGLSNSLHVMAVVLILLMYVVWKNYSAVKVIMKEHEVLVGGREGYVARIGGAVTSHTGSDGVGFGSVGGSEPFLAAYGPPVFYDIGDVNTQKKYNDSQKGSATTSDQYVIDYTKTYASGRPMFAPKTGADGKVYYVSLSDNVQEAMSDQDLLSRAQGFSAY
jgi:hypothetical protein